MILTRMNLPPNEYLTMSGDVFDCQNRDGGCNSHLMAKDVSKHPNFFTTTTAAKNYSAHKSIVSFIEKSWNGLNTR
jgi:hypothetical protein